MIYKTIDLCAGIGGIRRGFELTGFFQNVLSAEIDPIAAATYQHLFGEDPTNDLTSERFKQTVEETKYDVLLAGFPCQTFSSAGKKLGFRDATRGTIFFDIADIISRTTPKAVFLENVENLMFHDKGNTIETIIQALENELQYRIIGVTVDENGHFKYDRSSFVRNTKDFGLPQNRPRVYIMAFSKKLYGKSLKRINCQLPYGNDQTVFKDLSDLLEKDVPERYYLSQGYLETLKRHRERNRSNRNGFGYHVVNLTEGHRIAHTVMATGGSGKERNLVFQPKEGIAGKILKDRKSGINTEGIRVMTPEEWGRLQGFIGYAFLDENGNERFGFPENISDTQKYKQFGNSVSIPVIRTMAEFMASCLRLLDSSQTDIVREFAEKQACFTNKDIQNLLGTTANSTNVLLSGMVKNGSLKRLSKGEYSAFNRV